MKQLSLKIVLCLAALNVGTAVAEPDLPELLPEDSRAKFEGVTVVQQEIKLGDGEMSTLLRESTKTMDRFQKDPGTQIPEDLLGKAKCIAVFPEIRKGAVILGGIGGRGIALCRGTEEKQWSNFAFIKYSGATAGLQIGFQKTSIVALFMNDNAKEMLKKGEFNLSANASAIVGNKEAMKTKMTAQDVILYDDTKGAFLGASLSAAKIFEDSEAMQAFYKEPVTLTTTLETYDLQTKENPKEVNDLFVVLPPVIKM